MSVKSLLLDPGNGYRRFNQTNTIMPSFLPIQKVFTSTLRTMNPLSKLFVFLAAFACTNESDKLAKYQRILSTFKSYNYVVGGQSGNPTNEESANFRKDSLMYATAVSEFYQSDRSIIDFLILNFESCEGLSGLLVPFSNPQSSTLDPCELVDCKIGASSYRQLYLE